MHKKMQLLLLAVIIFMTMLVGTSFAIDKTTSFFWTQSLVSPIASWDIFRGTSVTGPWTLVKNVPFYALGTATEYTTSAPITVPDNSQSTVFFTIQATGTNGLKSALVPAITGSYDTRITPIVPAGYRVVIQ